MSNAIIPTRAVADHSIPVRWRVYLRLQVLAAIRGDALDWTPVAPVPLAAYFAVHPQTVYRALRWLVERGYLEQRRARGLHGGCPHAYRVVVDEGPLSAA
ncbi:MAG TPA: hypothetical protein VKQ30_23290 [Ktedonobacterales bacterium]|nr:hypothetical protein [Ktedonobacterales bacterium]